MTQQIEIRQNLAGVSLLTLILVSIATTASGAAVVEQLVKTKLSGGAGKVVNLFAGKVAKEGLATRTAVSGDRRATLTGKNVEVIDLGDEMIWRYTLGRRGKVKRCEPVTFEKFQEQMQAIADLPFFGGGQAEGADQAAGDISAPESSQYEVTLNFTETGVEETHAGITGKVYRFEAIAHRPGLSVDEGGGVLDTTFVVGPKTQAWTDMQNWNRRWVEQLGTLSDLGAGVLSLLNSSPALQQVMGELKEKEDNLDGTVLRISTTLSMVADPRVQKAKEEEAERESNASDNGRGVPTSLSGIGARLGGALLKRQQAKAAEKKAAEKPGPQELYTSSIVTTALSDATDPILTLPDKCR